MTIGNNTWRCAALLLIAAAGLLLGGCTKEERPADVLPAAVQDFCAEWFPTERVVSAERLDGGYRVTLCQGTRATFDATGAWRLLENYTTGLSRDIVRGPVAEYLGEHYGADDVLLLERRDGCRAGLRSGTLLIFDEDYAVTTSRWEPGDAAGGL